MHDSPLVEVQFASLLAAEDSEKGGEEVEVAAKLAETIGTLTEKTEEERKARVAQDRNANRQWEEKVSKELDEKMLLISVNPREDASASERADSETHKNPDAEGSVRTGASQDVENVKGEEVTVMATAISGQQPMTGTILEGAIQTKDEKMESKKMVSSDMHETSAFATFTTIPEKLKGQIGELRESLKVAVLWELLSACIADIPAEVEGHGLLPPGYDARHRAALRLLSCWLDVSWSKMVTSTHFIQAQTHINDIHICIHVHTVGDEFYESDFFSGPPVRDSHRCQWSTW